MAGWTSLTATSSSLGRGFRVAHVLAPATWGGLEQVVRSLAMAQAKNGHEVAVLAIVSDDNHPFVQRMRADDTFVAPIICNGRDYRRQRRQINILAGDSTDIVHTHGYHADVIVGSSTQSLPGRWISTVHGFTGGGWKNRFYERLQVMSYRRCSAVVAVSDRLSARLAKCGIPRSRLHMVRNGWSSEPAPLPRDVARARLGITSDEPRVGWIGRLSREKGADVFIQSLPALRTAGARASIVGDGVERARLGYLASGLGVADMIDWHGSIADAGAVCPAFDAFIMSSRTEGTPVVLLEAMAAGVPVVATAVGGIPAILSTDGGLLVPSESPVELAEAIQLTLTEPTAAITRAQISLARVLSEHSMARMAEAYQGVYESAIGGMTTAHV